MRKAQIESTAETGARLGPRELLGLLDLTTLEATDTEDRVRALCSRAMAPVPAWPGATVAAVCVHANFVGVARASLAGSGVRAACVAGAFPHGQLPIELRVAEIERAIEDGAEEVDTVIRRGLVLQDRLEELGDEVVALARPCARAGVAIKVIVETCELGGAEAVARTSERVLGSLREAGVARGFLKTSTGKGARGAEPELARAMLRAISACAGQGTSAVGFKAAGGVRTVADAMAYVELAREVCGPAWTGPGLMRVGASALLDEIARSASV